MERASVFFLAGFWECSYSGRASGDSAPPEDRRFESGLSQATAFNARRFIMGVLLDFPQLDKIAEMLERALAKTATAEWYTIEQAYVAKFGNPEHGPAMSTFKDNLALQPRGGIPDGWQQSKKAWRRETVGKWLCVDDTTLADYLAECSPGKKIPPFIEKALSKRPTMELRK